jgi:hypothetical protein
MYLARLRSTTVAPPIDCLGHRNIIAPCVFASGKGATQLGSRVATVFLYVYNFYAEYSSDWWPLPLRVSPNSWALDQGEQIFI